MRGLLFRPFLDRGHGDWVYADRGFPGRRNWGYDGVLPYGPASSYGRPRDLKALVEAAHARGIAVLLDVVHNHFGPDGNYLPVYAPSFSTNRHETPWGAAINCDGRHARPVREFIIGNWRWVSAARKEASPRIFVLCDEALEYWTSVEGSLE